MSLKPYNIGALTGVSGKNNFLTDWMLTELSVVQIGFLKCYNFSDANLRLILLRKIRREPAETRQRRVSSEAP